jgi:tetratricopeptide (TPR) repeat protein
MPGIGAGILFKGIKMLRDRYGNAVSTSSTTALAKFDEACELLRLYRGDPIGALDAALAADPDFGMAWALRAGVLVQQMDSRYRDEIERSLRAGAVAVTNERERAHLAAARRWADGHFHDAIVQFARIAQDNPRDLPALQTAHVGCFYTGRAAELRDWPLQSLRAFTAGDDGYHALLGMAAFGYEECGQYEAALATGQEAVRLEPRDAWAVHAVAHVHEMRGDTENGIPWLRDSAHAWAPENGFAYHNWWHLALLHMDRAEMDEVLRLYDTKVRPADTAVMLEWIDASALLWRLRLEGVDVGDRWAPLAERWSAEAEQRLYAFNDVHALMAFLGAGRSADAARVLTALRRTASGIGDNALMTRQVGLPVAEALIAFETGDNETAVDKIAPVRGLAQRFGGSHAQRDILSLTMLHAALRGGSAGVAESLAAERLAHKPRSPWARSLGQRAQVKTEITAAA